jgi:two-component sensor histidine kinase
MRGEVEAVARECGVGGEELTDVRVAVSEAAKNAVVHGSACRQDARVGVTVELTDTKMLVTISDNGPGPKTDSHMSFRVPSADAKEHDNAVRALEAALVEQDRVSERLDRAVGTSSEVGAYVRLKAAGAQVTARQAQLDRSALMS